MKRKPAFSAFELRSNAKKRKLKKSKSVLRRPLPKLSVLSRKGSPLNRLLPNLNVLIKRESLQRRQLLLPKLNESAFKRRPKPSK